MELYAASAMALDCADRLDLGITSIKELAMVNAYAPETWFRAFDRAIQVLSPRSTVVYDGRAAVAAGDRASVAAW